MTQFDVDTVTPLNRSIAQKNLHIDSLPPGPVPPRPEPVGEYVEFNNPFPTPREFDLFLDFDPCPGRSRFGSSSHAWRPSGR